MLSPRAPSPARVAVLVGRLEDLAPTDFGGRPLRADAETIGWGGKRYERARHSLRRLDQFAARGGSVTTPAVAIEAGTRIVVAVRGWGLWTLGPLEVVTVRDEADRAIWEFRTLEGHPLRGTERVELVRQPNGVVKLSIGAWSRPAVWWAWPVWPLVVVARRKFRRSAIDRIRGLTGRESTPEGPAGGTARRRRVPRDR